MVNHQCRVIKRSICTRNWASQNLHYGKTSGIDKMSNKVFMPGCSLPSYSPEGVAAIASYLKEVFPEMGAVQKCCGKPTAAIGQTEKFKERYGQLQADFDKLDAQEVIVACQSCYGMIKKSGGTQNRFHCGNCFQKSVCQKRYAVKRKTVTSYSPFTTLALLATKRAARRYPLDLERAWLQNLRTRTHT